MHKYKAYLQAGGSITGITPVSTSILNTRRKAPDWVLKTVVTLLLLGLPLALFFAWTFEMTPDGIKRATQNSELDVIAQGNCTGSKPLNEALASQRLQYGLLKQSDASFDGHASFGTPDSVIMLTERDTSYMRLDRVDE